MIRTLICVIGSFLAAVLADTAVTSAACIYYLSPTSAYHGPGSESGGFSVVTVNGCAWTAQTSEGWIHTSISDNGSGSVGYRIDANPTPSPRIGTINLGGGTFTIE